MAHMEIDVARNAPVRGCRCRSRASRPFPRLTASPLDAASELLSGEDRLGIHPPRAREVVEEDRAVARPELVYVGGYIRRRIPDSVSIPAIRGQNLYESGGLAGQGCSGGPVILKRSTEENNWPVIGVYIGERLDPARGLFVSYAARMDDLLSWTPEVLGQSLLDESHT